MQCASMNRRIDDALVETSVFAKTWNGYRQSRCRLDAQGIPTEDAETETGSKESDAASDTENYGWGGRIRTCAWRHQKPLPYRLATPQQCADPSQRGTAI